MYHKIKNKIHLSTRERELKYKLSLLSVKF